MAAEYKDYQEAMATLAKKPDDPEANRVAGEYLCLVKGDWARGLHMLATSDDGKYAWLAAKELKKITEPAEQVTQGDGWWNLAENNKGASQQQLRFHAVYWYRKAIPQLTGLLREKVQQRLAQAGEAETKALGGLIAGLENPFAGRTGLAKQSLLEMGGGNAKKRAGRGRGACLAGPAPEYRRELVHRLPRPLPRPGLHRTGLRQRPRRGHRLRPAALPRRRPDPRDQGPLQEQHLPGITWMISHQLPTGDLSFTGGQTQMYSHGLATIMLCEAYGMSHDRRLEAPAKAALHFIETCQDQQTGGWWYTFSSRAAIRRSSAGS